MQNFMPTLPTLRRLYHSPNGFNAVMNHYTAMLNSYPVPQRTFYVPTRYGLTHIAVSGSPDNPPLVLLHGLGVHAMMWKPNITDLSERFLVYAVDVIGDGGRSAGARPSMLDTSYALWLEDVLNQLRLPWTHVAGMSMGGWLALNGALHLPNRISRLFLIAPVGLVTLNTSLTMQALLSVMPHTWDTPQNIARLMARMSGDDLKHEITRMIYLSARHHRTKMIAPLPVLRDDELRQVQVPTTLVVGSQDEMFNAAGQIQRAQHIAGLQAAEVIDDAGHWMNVRQAGWVSARMVGALAG
jgi:pimeloyl-ACP methyl ester carboxylesterase